MNRQDTIHKTDKYAKYGKVRATEEKIKSRRRHVGVRDVI